MIAAVFDCVIYVQAFLSRNGPAFACLQLAEAEFVRLYLSPIILDEIQRTLAKAALRNRFKHITDESVAGFLVLVEKFSVITPDPPAMFLLRRDPKDEPYVNLAIETSARFIVSRDKDLLDLMHDSAFRTTYPTIQVLSPTAFLDEVRSQFAKGSD